MIEWVFVQSLNKEEEYFQKLNLFSKKLNKKRRRKNEVCAFSKM